MSNSRSNIKNFIRTGQFSKRFNVSKPTDMPDIPEEKMVDGRPVSQVKSEKGRPTSTVSEVKGEKGDNRASAMSSWSKTSTRVGSGLGIDLAKAQGPAHSPRPDDLLFIPPDIQTPTTFGPNNEYTAVPSIITYSSGGTKGMSRVTIREATASDPKPPGGYNLPTIAEGPQIQVLPPSYDPQQGNFPVIPPPPNFQPIQLPNDWQGPQPRVNPRVSHADSMRTSTTSIRTSTGTDMRDSTATDMRDSTVTDMRMSTADDTTDVQNLSLPAHTRHTSTTSTTSEAISEAGSNNSTLVSPHGSPVQREGTPNSDSQPLTSNPAWPLPSKALSAPPSVSTMYTPYQPSFKDSAPYSYDGSLGNPQSRFSWHVSKTDRAHDWFTTWFIEWWMMEIFSWIFSAICMMIIIIVLAKYDNKPLPSWKLNISINAFISIFSGFAKSALLLPTAEALGQLKWNWFRKSEKTMMDFEVMDSASRGPWGSMMMLARTKGITLASVGAAIILLSLPLDLFFQQIISYPSMAVRDISNATISRAILYDPADEYTWKNGTYDLPPDLQLDAFVYPFFQGSGIVPGVDFNCPTGNCTYDPFYTLALDSQCKEMPNVLEFTCQNTSAEWMTTVSYEGPYQNPNVTSCGWYLNVPGDQPQLMSGYEIQADGSIGEVLAQRFFPATDAWTNQQFWGGSPSFPDVQNPVTDFIMASTPGAFDGTLKNNTPTLTECEIHWVVKQLQATVTAGNLVEETLKTLPFETDLNGPYGPWDGYGSNTYLANFSMTLADPHSVTGEFSTFGLDNTTAKKVWYVWTEINPSTLNLPAKNNPVPSGPVIKYQWWLTPPYLTTVFDPLNPSGPWEPPNNVSQHVANAVTVMNQLVRRNTLSARHRQDVAVGQAWRYEVIVHVRWAWISLPVILLFFSLLFLIATVIRSTKEQDEIGVFKTSALAILFNGLGEDVQDHHGGPGHNRMGYTRERAKDIRVQLGED